MLRTYLREIESSPGKQLFGYDIQGAITSAPVVPVLKMSYLLT